MLRHGPHTKRSENIVKEARGVAAKGIDDRGKMLRNPTNKHYMPAVHRKTARCPRPEVASSHLKDGEINTGE